MAGNALAWRVVGSAWREALHDGRQAYLRRRDQLWHAGWTSDAVLQFRFAPARVEDRESLRLRRAHDGGVLSRIRMGGGGLINALTVMAALEAATHLARVCARMALLLMGGRAWPGHDKLGTL